MANQKHLVILKQGVVVWNEWCDRPQEAGIDFEKVDLTVCFISCAREDQSFAEKLCATMRVEGIRCWFTPDELHWGGRSQPSIEADSLYDKLIMVLSKHSVLDP